MGAPFSSATILPSPTLSNFRAPSPTDNWTDADWRKWAIEQLLASPVVVQYVANAGSVSVSGTACAIVEYVLTGQLKDADT